MLWMACLRLRWAKKREMMGLFWMGVRNAARQVQSLCSRSPVWKRIWPPLPLSGVSRRPHLRPCLFKRRPLSLSVRIPHGNSPFGENCAQVLAPTHTPGNYDHLTYDELHNPCRRRGWEGKDPKAAPRIRLATTDAVDQTRGRDIRRDAAVRGSSLVLRCR